MFQGFLRVCNQKLQQDKATPDLFDDELEYKHLFFTSTLAQRVSTYPIDAQWGKWLKMFQLESEEDRLLSHLGGPTTWMFAAPVGIRNAKSPQDFSLAACVFLGFDWNSTKIHHNVD